jgi:hypothetical protein
MIRSLSALRLSRRRAFADSSRQQGDAASYTWQTNPLEFSLSGDAPSPLYPRATPSPINLTLSNPNSYSVAVLSLTVTVAGVTAPNATGALPCSASDFTTGAHSGAAFSLSPGTSTLSGPGIPRSQWPTVARRETNSSRDGCKGASRTLTHGGSGQS